MDREKIIKGLECCCEHIVGMNCDHCPYDKEQIEIGQINQCTSALAYDSLAMLKEQEHKDKLFHALEDDWKRLKELLKEQEAAYQGAVELLRQKTILFDDAIKRLKEQEAVEPIPPTDESDLWRCGNCNHQIFRCKHQQFCEMCGREVKWK